MTSHGEHLLVSCDPESGHVYSFEWDSGNLRWVWPSGSGVSSGLIVVDGLVILVTLDNELVALDVAYGVEEWRTVGVAARRATRSTATPVVIDGDIMWGRQDGMLSRRVASTGEIVWETELPAAVSTDLLQHGGNVILGLVNGHMVRIDPADGNVLSDSDLGVMPTYRWLPVDNDHIVGMTGTGRMERLVMCVDATTLETIWTFETPDEIKFSNVQPALGWGAVLVATDEPALYAIDPTSGALKWKATVAHPPRTIKIVDDDLYIGTFSGTLSAYRK